MFLLQLLLPSAASSVTLIEVSAMCRLGTMIAASLPRDRAFGSELPTTGSRQKYLDTSSELNS